MSELFTLKVTPGGEPDTLEKALSMLPPTGRARILLSPGTWVEKIVITRPDTILEGAGPDKTVLTWDDCATAPYAPGETAGTFRTATLRVAADRVTLRRLRVENAAWPRETCHQAIALYVNGDQFLCENCRLDGYQDTLFLSPLPPFEIEPNGFRGPDKDLPRRPQRHLFRRCSISGDIDFIFGGSAAFFDSCELISRDGRKDRHDPFVGFCAAPSTPKGQEMGFVFYHCRFLSDRIPKGSVYLARPWRDDAKAAFIQCGLDEHINPLWFHDWDKPQARESAVFAVYQLWGPGILGEHCSFARVLNAEEAEHYSLECFERFPLPE